MFWKVLITAVFYLLTHPPAWAQKQLVDRVVAVVNDEAITQSEIDIYLRPLYEGLRQQYQGDELMRQLHEIRLKLLNQVIEDRLVYQESKARGISVDESEIDRMLEETKSRFASEEEFEKMMASQGYVLSDLRENYRRQLAIRRLHDMEIRIQVVVSPQEIEDYYKDRKSEFAEEESIKLYSITVKKDDETVRKGIVDETAKERIESLRQRVMAGENFNDLAKQFSEDANAKEGGAVGWVNRGTMIPAIDQALFQLDAGAISPVLESQAAYHLFKIEEKKTSRVPPLDEVREKIRGILFKEEANKRFKDWMNELKGRAYISIR